VLHGSIARQQRLFRTSGSNVRKEVTPVKARLIFFAVMLASLAAKGKCLGMHDGGF
jgi:hypothetical protein